MRRFINATATVEDLELHGFWHRGRETLVVTGLSIHHLDGVATRAFWLSLCGQMGIPTGIFREGGPTAVARELFRRNPRGVIRFCAEWQEDGSIVFRAPRVTPAAEKATPPVPQSAVDARGGKQGSAHACRRDATDSGKVVARSSAAAVPPCSQQDARCTEQRRGGPDRRTGADRPAARPGHPVPSTHGTSSGRWAPAPAGALRPSLN